MGAGERWQVDEEKTMGHLEIPHRGGLSEVAPPDDVTRKAVLDAINRYPSFGAERLAAHLRANGYRDMSAAIVRGVEAGL